MATSKKISQLTTASSLTGTELVTGLQGGDNKNFTTAQIAALSGGGGGGLPTPIAASNVLAFSGNVIMAPLVQTANITLTRDVTGAVLGGGGTRTIHLDGTHTITAGVGLSKLSASPNFADFTGIADDEIEISWLFNGLSYVYWINEIGVADITAPSLTSVTATGANTLVYLFSEAVALTSLVGLTASKGTAISLAGFAGSGTSTITVTTSTTMLTGDTITTSYDATIGNIADLAANPLASFTSHAVNNSIAPPVTITDVVYQLVAGVTESPAKTWNIDNLVTTYDPTHTLPSGTDGIYYMDFTTSDHEFIRIGIDNNITTNAPTSGGNGVWLFSITGALTNSVLAWTDQGSPDGVAVGLSYGANTKIGIQISGGGTVAQAVYSNDNGVTFTSVHSSPTTLSGTIRLKAFSATGTRIVKNPKLKS